MNSSQTLNLVELTLADIGWWPIAWGWWVLVFLVLCIGILVGIWWWQGRHARAIKQAAQQEFHDIEVRFKQSHNAEEFAQSAMLLMKRIMKAYQQQQALNLTEKEWVQQLHDFVPQAKLNQSEDLLMTIAYRSVSYVEGEQLRQTIKPWFLKLPSRPKGRA